MTVRMLKPGTVSMVILKFSSGTSLNLSQEDYEELISYGMNDENLLSKAKEIIRKFLRFEPVIGHVSFYHEEWENTKKTAEQFLKKSGN